MQTQTSNALYNAIMEAGGKDRPPMLAPGNYVQWKSRIKRYIDTKPNNELIHYCLQNPPYTYQWTEKTVPVAKGSSKTTTERLKQGESINVQDLETNLYWEFGKFTSRDGESLESYYSRAHYMYMAQIQEVTLDAVDNSGPIFDAEPSHKEQGDTNITIDSLDICYDREQDDQDDTDELDQERVIPSPSVSRPQLKSNPLEDRVMPNNSQGKNKK
nr:hypothetical protein [Tanacetum cinerariifolium]